MRGMGKGLREWLKKRGLEKYLKRDNLIILVLAGILLFVIALPAGEGGKEGERTGQDSEPILSGYSSGGTQQAEGGQPEWDDGARYAAELEKRLTDALSAIDAVGRVRVMITLKSSGELVVEKEISESRSVTAETDSQGGNRSVNTGQQEERVVYSTEGGVSSPYVVKSLTPEIEGVLVVAEGAGTGKVNRTVTEIVQALFGVEAHKVKVVRMKE